VGKFEAKRKDKKNAKEVTNKKVQRAKKTRLTRATITEKVNFSLDSNWVPVARKGGGGPLLPNDSKKTSRYPATRPGNQKNP